MSRSGYSISANSLLRCMQSDNMHVKYFYILGNLATNQQLLVWACVLNPLSHKTFVQFVLEILSYHVLSFPRKFPCEVTLNATYGETSTLTSQNSFIRAAMTKIINYFFQLTWGNRTPGGYMLLRICKCCIRTKASLFM